MAIITGRINSWNGKLQSLEAASPTPGGGFLSSYQIFCMKKTTNHPTSSNGDLVFYGKLSEPYIKISLASLHFLWEMLYVCDHLYIGRVCVCVHVCILLNTS